MDNQDQIEMNDTFSAEVLAAQTFENDSPTHQYLRGIFLGTIQDKEITPLMIACINTHKNVVKELLKSSRLDLNKKSYLGFTALHMATINSDVKIVRLLIRRGADVQATCNQGVKPYDIAEYIKNTQLMEILKSTA